MPHSRLIVIWGTSLLLSLVADQLSREPGLTVARFNPDRAGDCDRVRAESPAVLIAEIMPDRVAEVDRVLLELMATCQHMPVIRLDAQSGAASVLSSRPLALNSLNDVVQAVEALLAES